MMAMNNLMHQLAARCNPTVFDGVYIMDTSVYGDNQLFRAPYCGKMGELNAELRPIRPYRVGMRWEYSWSDASKHDVFNQSCISSHHVAGFTELRVEEEPRQRHLALQAHGAPPRVV